MEIAEREALEAEAELGAEEPEPEPKPEPKPEPEPTPEPSGLDHDQLAKAIEREQTRHEKALRNIVGDPFELYTACDQCGTIGFLLPEFQPMPPLLEARDKAACDGCNGHGIQISHSLNENHLLEPCLKCNGNGWVTVAIPEPAPAWTPPTEPGIVAGAPPDTAWTGNDPWGRPAGHAHWGMNPATIGA